MTSCSLAIVPPRELWPALEAIRSVYDKSYDSWPPHINLAWPFYPAGASQLVQSAIQGNPDYASIRPFTVRLARFHSSPNSKYMHLIADTVPTSVTPSNQKKNTARKRGGKKGKANGSVSSLMELCGVVRHLYPECFRDSEAADSQPHLSIGQVHHLCGSILLTFRLSRMW